VFSLPLQKCWLIPIQPECPVCHLPLTIDLEAEAIELSEDQINKTKQGILGRLDLDGWRSSSKIEALVEELSTLRKQDRTIKSIVFSQLRVWFRPVPIFAYS